MALQILSDLHLEAPKAYDIFEIAPKAPYLALLGDVGNIAKDKDDCLAFLTQQLKQFRAVLFVPGNHEAYHSTWPETLSILRAFEEQVRNDASLGEFVLLDRTAYKLPGTTITVLGCSLFSAIPKENEEAVSFGMNDFFHIEGWDVKMHHESHVRDLAWLNEQVGKIEEQNDDTKIVILTHWSPTRDARSVDPRHGASPISSGFSTDLSGEVCFKSEKVKVWAFGHTHFNCDFTVDRECGVPLRLLANQRGYYFSQAKGVD
ncbi:uncharacterized protein EI97DRAFT_431740 [Westerdykella ornata]|uniref:Calcineurin-like phosphoesterase domain-containing protein n=1 Tax=Westerdykella ornata TaxID=318751 RepID=A0A6A6JQH4_WESOR|nr:uncharacterized protein EI97DRAFT_431740 [Westerdykella ornata]KAF2278515.1 hypothetical protein EI97DRAFT_431740 [Westerdykella ornata]